MTKDQENKPQSIIARRAYHRIFPTIVCFVILTALPVTLFVFGCIYSEPSFLWIAGLLEILFFLILVLDLIVRVSYNHLNEVAITTLDNELIVYQKDMTITIAKEAIYDFTYKNEISYFVTPYFTTTTTYNYGKIFLYFIDEKNQKIKTIMILK